MDFKTYLSTVPADIDRRLDYYLEQWVDTHMHYSPLLQPLYVHFKDACADGKRLRATLVKLGFDMTGGVSNDAVYDVALAYEIFQTAILAHDDIIDKSPLRRGKPTLHKALESHGREFLSPQKNMAHYGLSQTICLGDMGLYMAIQLIADSDFEPTIKNKAISYFTQTVIDTIAGELLDVELPYVLDPHNITADDLMSVCRYKTARYTITGPLMLGSLLANASDYTRDAIKNFGDHLGIAFQLKDDLLGIFGDEKTIGKSVTSDCEEGKITLLYRYAMEHATAEQKDLLNAHYGTGALSAETHAHIIAVFTDTNAKKHVEDLMQDYADKALSFIPDITSDDRYRQLLTDFTHYMIKRDR
jgi:geranylgeranyl diphosphate synthase type I